MIKTIPTDSVLIPDTAKLVFKGVTYDVYQWDQPVFDGSTETFEMLKRPDTVIVLAIVDGRLLVLDDEQPHRGKRESLPGGRVNSQDKTIQVAAQRETLEETGYGFSNWRLIKVYQPETKIEWFTYTWLAWGAYPKVSPQLDPGEKITVKTLTINEVQDLINSGADPLRRSSDLFRGLTKLEDLINLPEFQGRTVDR